MDVWGCKVPLKIQIFCWRFSWCNHTIEFVIRLKLKYSGTKFCRVCNQRETSDLFFLVHHCKFPLGFPKHYFELADDPNLYYWCFWWIVERQINEIKSSASFLFLHGQCRCLWKTRNDMVFNAKLLSFPWWRCTRWWRAWITGCRFRWVASDGQTTCYNIRQDSAEIAIILALAAVLFHSIVAVLSFYLSTMFYGCA